MSVVVDDLLLLPPPQSLRFTGGTVNLRAPVTVVSAPVDPFAAAAECHRGADAEPPELRFANSGDGDADVLVDFKGSADAPFSGDESYTLNITPGAPAVTLHGATLWGAVRGFHTLLQLFSASGTSLPALLIEDHPDFPNRGVMLDVSRCRVPTLETLRRQVRRFASWKVNHLQLYTEHTFAYRGHEVVWRDASPFTPEEYRGINRLCRSLGITFAANQNCFGHMERWLRHPRYAGLAEIPDAAGSKPRSLCPGDPASVELVRDILGQLLPNFTSGIVNIGCDETWDVGKGRSADAVQRLGYARVWGGFVERILNIVREHDFRPQLWADMALQNPEVLDMLRDVTWLVWGYEPETPFREWCGQLRKRGLDCWVCPGTSAWRSITGRTFERRSNITAAATAGVEAGATGLLMTEWGDMGHHQQLPVSLQGLADGAAAAWKASAADETTAAAFSLHAHDDPTLTIGGWLERLGDADLPLRRKAGAPDSRGLPKPLVNSSALFRELHEPFRGGNFFGDPDDWRAVVERLTELEREIPATGGLTGRELRFTLRMARFATRKALARRGAAGVEGLAVELRELIAEHRRLWLTRSRPGGLAESSGHYEKVLEDLTLAENDV